MPSFITASIASFVATPSWSVKTASLIIGIRIRFETNPGKSWTSTGVFPRRSHTSRAAFSVASLVWSPRTTSTSFIRGTGLKKWSPMKRSGRLVAAASSVIEIEEVLLAKITCPEAFLSSSANTCLFRAASSGTASMIRSASAASSRRVVGRMRARAAFRMSSVTFPFSTAFARPWSITARPFTRNRSSTSRITTSNPATAATWAIPAPIWPAPRTPTFWMGTGAGWRRSVFELAGAMRSRIRNGRGLLTRPCGLPRDGAAGTVVQIGEPSEPWTLHEARDGYLIQHPEDGGHPHEVVRQSRGDLLEREDRREEDERAEDEARHPHLPSEGRWEEVPDLECERDDEELRRNRRDPDEAHRRGLDAVHRRAACPRLVCGQDEGHEHDHVQHCGNPEEDIRDEDRTPVLEAERMAAPEHQDGTDGQKRAPHDRRSRDPEQNQGEDRDGDPAFRAGPPEGPRGPRDGRVRGRVHEMGRGARELRADGRPAHMAEHEVRTDLSPARGTSEDGVPPHGRPEPHGGEKGSASVPRRRYGRSRIIAIAFPPPRQRVASPRFAPRSFIAYARVVRILVPVHPSG